jgi:DNA-binding NarL/FixJ family response regulator
MTTQNSPLAPRVLIADDHPLYCDALRAVVPQACPGADISEANSQEQVLAAVAAAVAAGREFSLVLLDLNLPGATGLSCLAELRRTVPTTPIVVVSAVGDPKIMQDVIMGGACAFIPKSAPGQVLINALRVILAGGTYMPTGIHGHRRGAARRRRRRGAQRTDPAPAASPRIAVHRIVE